MPEWKSLPPSAGSALHWESQYPAFKHLSQSHPPFLLLPEVLFSWFTVVWNVTFPAWIFSSNASRSRPPSFVLRIARTISLSSSFSVPPGHFSGTLPVPRSCFRFSLHHSKTSSVFTHFVPPLVLFDSAKTKEVVLPVGRIDAGIRNRITAVDHHAVADIDANVRRTNGVVSFSKKIKSPGCAFAGET